MVLHPTRRRLVRFGTLVAGTTLAGCTGMLGDSDGSDDPDAGTDSYGVLVENSLQESYAVSLRGENVIQREVVLEEAIEIGPDETREREQVFTEEGFYRLTASVDSEDFDHRNESDGFDFEVARDRAPDIENLLVLLRSIDTDEDDDIVGNTGPQVLVTPTRPSDQPER